MFEFRHLNRIKYPQKHIIVCEDDLSVQAKIATHFASIFEHQGDIQFSFVPSAIAAAHLIAATTSGAMKVNLLLLDHDMPEGNGTDLINWLHKFDHEIPIISFSGIESNNLSMQKLYRHAFHLYSKDDVLNGKADELLKLILNLQK